MSKQLLSYHYLHYTLLLLIQLSQLKNYHKHKNLHYTLLLLIHERKKELKNKLLHLHYTLLLLILPTLVVTSSTKFLFTLHFATINTDLTILLKSLVEYLHYTLLLLIHYYNLQIFFYFRDLHYTLLLLIQWYDK